MSSSSHLGTCFNEISRWICADSWRFEKHWELNTELPWSSPFRLKNPIWEVLIDLLFSCHCSPSKKVVWEITTGVDQPAFLHGGWRRVRSCPDVIKSRGGQWPTHRAGRGARCLWCVGSTGADDCAPTERQTCFLFQAAFLTLIHQAAFMRHLCMFSLARGYFTGKSAAKWK